MYGTQNGKATGKQARWPGAESYSVAKTKLKAVRLYCKKLPSTFTGRIALIISVHRDIFLHIVRTATSAISWTARNIPYAEHVRMKVRDILRMLQEGGWYIARTRGSHRQLKHPTKSGTVTVAGKPGVDIPPGALKSILKQSGLEP